MAAIPNLKLRAEETTRDIQKILGVSPDDHSEEISAAIEVAIARALVKERNRCADVAASCVSSVAADNELARKIVKEVGTVKSLIVSNLGSMR